MVTVSKSFSWQKYALSNSIQKGFVKNTFILNTSVAYMGSLCVSIVINVKFHMVVLHSVIVLHFWLIPEVLIKQSG